MLFSKCKGNRQLSNIYPILDLKSSKVVYIYSASHNHRRSWESTLSFTMEDIIWLDVVVDKLAWKRSVLPSEVEDVLAGRCRIFKRESGNVEGEDLYNALGKTKGGRYLSVFFIRRLGRALIITARDMNNREHGRYEKK